MCSRFFFSKFTGRFDLGRMSVKPDASFLSWGSPSTCTGMEVRCIFWCVVDRCGAFGGVNYILYMREAYKTDSFLNAGRLWLCWYVGLWPIKLYWHIPAVRTGRVQIDLHFVSAQSHELFSFKGLFRASHCPSQAVWIFVTKSTEAKT